MVCACILISVLIVITALIFFKIRAIFKTPPIPKLEDTWWGPGNRSNEDTEIKPFKINVSNEILDDLRQRLTNALPFQSPLEGVKHHYGINTNLLKNVVEFWKTQYNWREREEFLNQFPQFKVRVQGLNIHYIHVKPKETKGIKVLPLLLLHGWPGSVREFYKIIPLLTAVDQGRNFTFEVIAPSLPGYGFSDAAVRPGLGAAQVAVLFKNFMSRLGFEKYYIQGGDWGGIIVTNMATLFPEKIIGVHFNFCFLYTPFANFKLFLGSFYPKLVASENERLEKVYPLKKTLSAMILETGYMHLQATKPDTVGVALRDSPAGLAAYILEKFATGTNAGNKDLEDGGLTKKFTNTELLDNIMIYWVTRSMTTAMRLYAETFTKAHFGLKLNSIPVTVPSGFARFSNEITYPLVKLLREKYKNLIHVADYNAGHFAAFEAPDLLAKDIFEFTERVEISREIYKLYKEAEEKITKKEKDS